MNQNKIDIHRPRISIITVCYNEESGIGDTCESVVSQTFKDYEWLVVDGGSTDNTLGVVNNYRSNIRKVVSEKDNGVYDAMNKGIKMARGEYLLFLNGGDSLYGDDVLEKVFGDGSFSDDVLFGNCSVLMKDGSSVILDFDEKIDKYYLLDTCINHQSTFIKKDLFDKYGPYDQKYKILADYEKWHYFLSKNIKFKKLPFVVSNFRFFNGLSSQNKTKKINDREKKIIIEKYFKRHELLFHKTSMYCKKILNRFILLVENKIGCAINFKKVK